LQGPLSEENSTPVAAFSYDRTYSYLVPGMYVQAVCEELGHCCLLVNLE